MPIRTSTAAAHPSACRRSLPASTVPRIRRLPPDCSSRAILEFRPRTGTGSYANFAPRLGLVWDPKGDGKQTLRIGAAILYDSTETWFNERETTNPPYGNDIDVGSTGTLSNPWAGYAGGNPFPQKPGALFFPQFGTYINMPINPDADLRRAVERHLPAPVRQGLGGSASATSATIPPTCGSPKSATRPSITTWRPACISGVTYTPCASHHRNTNQRRILYTENPAQGVVLRQYRHHG